MPLVPLHLIQPEQIGWYRPVLTPLSLWLLPCELSRLGCLRGGFILVIHPPFLFSINFDVDLDLSSHVSTFLFYPY